MVDDRPVPDPTGEPDPTDETVPTDQTGPSAAGPAVRQEKTMNDRLGDLLARAADDELEGIVLELPEPTPQRRRWALPALAAAAVVAVVAGSVLVLGDRPERVTSLDPADTSQPPTTAVADPAAEELVAAVRTTLADPWVATVSVGVDSVEELRFTPTSYELLRGDGTSTLWLEGQPADGILNPFELLFDGLSDPSGVASEEPGVFDVEVPFSVCVGALRDLEPSDPVSCTVRVLTRADDGTVQFVEIDDPGLPESVRIEIGSAPTPSTTTSTVATDGP